MVGSAGGAGMAGLLPPGRIVRRAREWHLYDQAGTRYTDFWQGGGSAFLGHRVAGVARTVKAEIDRGLWSAAPNRWERRLTRVLAALASVASVDALTLEDAPYRWWPLCGVFTTEGKPAENPSGPVRVVPPGLPVVMPLASPVYLAAAVAGLLALQRYLDLPEATARRDLAAGLAVPPGYERHGVGFFPGRETSPAGYQRVRLRALDAGILLPPGCREVVVCPGTLGPHERKNWEVLNAQWNS